VKEEEARVVQEKPDNLRLEMKRRQKEAGNYILNAAKLIAPVRERERGTCGRNAIDWYQYQ